MHANLIRYFDKEEDKDFVYLAIEQCEGNLEDYVELIKMARKNPNSIKESKLGKIFGDNTS